MKQSELDTYYKLDNLFEKYKKQAYIPMDGVNIFNPKYRFKESLSTKIIWILQIITIILFVILHYQ